MVFLFIAMNRNRDVTVVVACFNYGQFLPEAVQSVLDQDGGPPQIIVVDDGSNDGRTPAALAALPDEVEVVRQPNRGVCAARNAGLARATTPYVLVLDADDRLTRPAMSAMRAALDADPALGFSYGFMSFFGDWHGVMRFPPYDPYALLHRHTIGLSALMRRQVMEDTGGFDPAFEHYEDWELWINALAHGWRGRQVDAVTLEYRRHAGAKQSVDRRRYHSSRRALRIKHAGLYADARRMASESPMGLAGRLAHRLYWGPRPLPARVERALYGLRFTGRGGGAQP